MKVICITGATGHMGTAALHLLVKTDSFTFRLLALNSRSERKKLAPYLKNDRITIVWGSLTCYEDVLAAVDGSDIILHLGALIPPASDYHPDEAMRVNYEGTLNVIRAAAAQPNRERSKLVYIGTIAESGSRLPPLHWGRVGDPLQASLFDAYGESKIKAERAVIESGLPGWVSLRQTAMLYPELFTRLDPIIFHQPLETHMEWVTAGDTARALHNLCLKEDEGTLPETFWRKVYHIGGGSDFRKTNEEFMQRGFQVMGIRDFRRVTEPNWFATGNFHGFWFLDSDLLDSILDFRRDTFEGFFEELERTAPLKRRILRRLAAAVPPWILKNLLMRPLARMPHGTLHVLRTSVEARIKAYWGSRSAWSLLPASWSTVTIRKNPSVRTLSHGFDETKPPSELTLEDMRAAAVFRGGSCLSESMITGDLETPLLWCCEDGHTFSASPSLILATGHWCPICDTAPTAARHAAGDLFHAQVRTLSGKLS